MAAPSRWLRSTGGCLDVSVPLQFPASSAIRPHWTRSLDAFASRPNHHVNHDDAIRFGIRIYVAPDGRCHYGRACDAAYGGISIGMGEGNAPQDDAATRTRVDGSCSCCRKLDRHHWPACPPRSARRRPNTRGMVLRSRRACSPHRSRRDDPKGPSSHRAGPRCGAPPLSSRSSRQAPRILRTPLLDRTADSRSIRTSLGHP